MSRMQLKGRKVLVVGLARSGIAAAELLLREGADVTVNDQQKSDSLALAVKNLKAAGARCVFGKHPEALFLESELIVVSPGVPRDLEPLQAARRAGVEIITELELAARQVDFPLIAITGTNGKSTTTTFVGQFLRSAGRRVFVGGNLGTPLSVATLGDHDIGVVEVSSFQLEWSPTFRPAVGVVLNVTEDHLDRYRDFEDYAETKGLLFINQGETDYAIANQGDAWTLRLASRSSGRHFTFGHGDEVTCGIRHVDGALYFGRADQWQRISLDGFRPRGRHNIENLMAAFLAAHLAGVPVERLESLIPHLEGLPHRLEPVRTLGGVQYFNDSKATNVNSVLCSLQDFKEKVVLLMGGRDKGGSYAPLLGLMRQTVRTLIVFGEAKLLIHRAFDGLVPIVSVESLAEATAAARQAALPGDSVVLSPACSSYDQFPNYEVRGETFKRLVWSLEDSPALEVNASSMAPQVEAEVVEREG